MKNYIHNELNPSKKNFVDSTKEVYEELKSIDEILASLEISKHHYEDALLILMTMIFGYITRGHQFHVL